MQPISIQQDAIFIADSHHHSLYNNVLDDFFQTSSLRCSLCVKTILPRLILFVIVCTALLLLVTFITIPP